MDAEYVGSPGRAVVAEPHDIDLTKAGVRIDGALLAELSVSALSEALGEPRVVAPESDGANALFIWDRAGVLGWSKDRQELSQLQIRLAVDPEGESRAKFDFFEMRPRAVFSGRFTVGGKAALDAIPEKVLRKAYIFLEIRAGDWEATFQLTEATQRPIADMPFSERLAALETPLIADLVRDAENPFRDVSISYAPPKPVKKSSGKWKLAAPSEPVLEFARLPFKYAIVHELMYEQMVLEPKFDVYDFAADQGARSFDPIEVGYDAIPMVRSWFKKLPVPARFAESVTKLTLDGGNDIYLQLAPQWDGEDEQFNIRSIAESDLAQFPNLRRVDDIGGFLSKTARRTLELHGIEVY